MHKIHEKNSFEHKFLRFLAIKITWEILRVESYAHYLLPDMNRIVIILGWKNALKIAQPLYKSLRYC